MISRRKKKWNGNSLHKRSASPVCGKHDKAKTYK